MPALSCPGEGGSLLAALPFAQAVANLLADFPHPHAVLNHQLAGDCGALRRPFTQVINHATVLAVLIPAEAAVRNGLRNKILQTAKQNIVFRNTNFSTEELDRDQAGKGTEEGGWSRHLGLFGFVWPGAP